MSRTVARKFWFSLSLAACGAALAACVGAGGGPGGGGDVVMPEARAAAAYDKYQNCGLRAARGLFATGW